MGYAAAAVGAVARQARAVLREADKSSADGWLFPFFWDSLSANKGKHKLILFEQIVDPFYVVPFSWWFKMQTTGKACPHPQIDAWCTKCVQLWKSIEGLRSLTQDTNCDL